jgi:hypothetical protein
MDTTKIYRPQELLMKTVRTASSATDMQNLNSVLAWACALLAALLPLAFAYQLLSSPTDNLLMRAGLSLTNLQIAMLDISVAQKCLAAVLGVMPVCLASWGLVSAMRCFSGFSQGEYFSARNVSYLRGFAAGIFASVVASVFSSTLIGLVLTWPATGRHALTLGMGSNELLTLLFAGMVWQIAAVMARAVAEAEEETRYV